MDILETLGRLEDLVSPYGVVSRVWPRRPAPGLPELNIHLASVGSAAAYHEGFTQGRPVRSVHGSGLDLGDANTARLIAIAEAAERYASGDAMGEPVRWARAAELEGAVIDAASIPRCSARELALPGCPLPPLDPEAVIRWVRGTDLVSGEPTWVPAVMAAYGLSTITAAERFWYRISTGYAVHTDPVEALVRGLCEVIERDAVAVTWLQRLPLPLVGDQKRSSLLEDVLAWSERHFVDTYLFDATSNLGVPTVYCLQVAQFDAKMRQAVSCATGRTIASAAESALLEALRYRLPGLELPDAKDPGDFSDITDGAAYMGRPEHAEAFDFLVAGAHLRIAPPPPALPEHSAEALAQITGNLAANGMRAIAVDRTPRELAVAGLTAVCIVVPELQPMSLLPRARYLGHPRLYEAPRLMGFPSYPEEELNPWPQPFA